MGQWAHENRNDNRTRQTSGYARRNEDVRRNRQIRPKTQPQAQIPNAHAR
jgi:hypothetical protein